ANVRAPVAIDVREEVWGVEDDAPFDAMISLNAALGLLAGGARLLRPEGVLFLYGPCARHKRHRQRGRAPRARAARGRGHAGKQSLTRVRQGEPGTPNLNLLLLRCSSDSWPLVGRKPCNWFEGFALCGNTPASRPKLSRIVKFSIQNQRGYSPVAA